MSKLSFIASGLALAALLLGGSLAQAQTTNLRKLNTENDALAWTAVGRLDLMRSGYCTGTLIAPDLVLTAAHCVYSKPDGKPLKPSDIVFQAGLTNGIAMAKRTVIQIEAHKGYDPNQSHNGQNIRHDLALLRLSEPIPPFELSPFSVFPGQVPPGPVSVVSYGKGRSEALSRQNMCQVLGSSRKVIALDCDVTFGSSGAPVFTHLNGRGQIASVISGGGMFAGKRVAYGMALPELVADLKRQMRANKARPKATVRRLGVGENKSSSGAKFVRAKGS